MQKTPLHAKHVALGARMVDFGGWDMPVQYGIITEEHRNTREKAGLFDICHMGELKVEGPEALALLQKAISRELGGMENGQMRLGVLCNEAGGILDDLTVYKLADEKYMVVTNASTKDGDLAQILKVQRDFGFTDAKVVDSSAVLGKLDLQGPVSQAILQPLVADDLRKLKFYHFVETEILGGYAIVSRSGYTGEDGFEIYLARDKIGVLWDKLFEIGAPLGLKPIGLGARDTLRLECAMNLYGHEMDDKVTPLECRYGWVTNLDKDFVGVDALRELKARGLGKKLVGFELVDRGIARNGYDIVAGGQKVGVVTSGTISPTLGKAIGLGYVPPHLAVEGTEIGIQIRDNVVKAQVVKLPFYKRG